MNHGGMTDDGRKVYHYLKRRWDDGECPVKASYITLAENCFQESLAKKASLKRRAIAAVKRLVNAGLIKKYPIYDGTYVWGNNYELITNKEI